MRAYRTRFARRPCGMLTLRVQCRECERRMRGRILVVSGLCGEGGEQVPYKAPIGILYGLSIRDSTNRRITS
jgi:hypothetical protein